MKSKSIFCIDDDKLVLERIDMLPQTEGINHVCKFTNVYQAIDALKTATPMLILLDVDMPEMNGITSYHKIRALPNIKDVPIVFVTGMKSENNLAQYKKLGTPVITKPVDPHEFQKLINIYLPK